MTGGVAIVAWSHVWTERFEGEKRALLGAFAPNAVEVEHIGSTAVRGLAAKPIVDMLLGAASLDESLGLNCTWYADILLTLTDCNASVECIAPPPTSAP